MPKIRPISDLRNRTDEISRICHQSGEPVYITKNGREDLVVLSVAAWEREQKRFELYRLLDEAEAEFEAGHRGYTMAQVRKRLGRPRR
jgi:prevent-host-death family protein